MTYHLDMRWPNLKGVIRVDLLRGMSREDFEQSLDKELEGLRTDLLDLYDHLDA